MRKLCFFILLLCIEKSYAQSSSKEMISAGNIHGQKGLLSLYHDTVLSHMEDSIIYWIKRLQRPDTSLMKTRSRVDSMLIRSIMSALKIPYAFQYPFLKLQQYMSIVIPNDSAFRIVTWQYTIDDLSAVQQGFIQINTKDGEPKIYPLLDRSSHMQNIVDTITNNKCWIGALYYRIIMKTYKGKRLYTLLGIDEHTIMSTRKYIEILHFNKQGEPIFGGHYFDFSSAYNPVTQQRNALMGAKGSSLRGAVSLQTSANTKKIIRNKAIVMSTLPPLLQQYKHFSRYFIEYHKATIANLRYDEDLDMIIFDRLMPSNEATKERKYSYVVGGDYEGFIWQKGKWVYIPNVFNFTLQDGQAPLEKPLDLKQNLMPASKSKKRHDKAR